MPEITSDKIDVVLEDATKKDIQSIEEAPESFGSWLNLELSEEKLQTITDRILEEINNIEEDRVPWYEKVKQYRNMYNQKVKETSLPFSGSFNLCYHKDTEVLTSEGWRFIRDVKVGDKVLSREPLTAKLEYKDVSATQHFKNIPKLINIKHRSFELLVTEDHNIYLENPGYGSFRFVKAKDLPKT